MSQSQLRMPKWKPRIADRLVPLFKKYGPISPKEASKELNESQSSVSMCMIKMYERKELKRFICRCGRGYIYEL